MKRKTHALIVVLAAVAALLATAGAAGAATSIVSFSGTITSAMNVNNGANLGSIPGGKAYTGTLTYDAAQLPAPVAFGGGTRTVYTFTNLAFTIGTSTANSGPGAIDVFDNLTTTVGYPAGDSVYVNFTQGVANSMGVAPSGLLAGAAFNWMGLALLDATGKAVTGGALPANFGSAGFSVLFSEFNFGTWGTPFGAGNTSMIQGLSTVATTSGGTVTPPPPAPISFAPALPGGTVGSAYAATFGAATGGSGAITYTASGLPAGLSLAGTSISGTPTVAGSYNVVLTATDAASVSASTAVAVTIAPAPLPAVPCSGSNGVESAYVARNPGFVVVNGGLGLLDHLWTTNLTPANTTFLGGLVNWFQTGLILSWTGTSDPAGCILDHLTVSPAVGAGTTALPTATAGIAYAASASASFGATPVAVAVSGLPAGLSFDGSTITGKPSEIGTFPLLFTATDGVGATATWTVDLIVVDQAVTFAPSLPAGTVGTSYTRVLAASGFGPFSYAAAGLPAGLTLAGSTVSGTPTTAGTSTVTFTATDAAGVAATVMVPLTINPAPVVTGGSYTVEDEASGRITAVDAIAGTIVVGSKKLIWNASTRIVVNTPSGERHVIDGFVKVGQRVQWKGLRDRATGIVLTSQLEVN